MAQYSGECLRFGAGAQRFDLTGTALIADGKDTWKSHYESAEYVGSRVKFRSEVRTTRIERADVNFKSYYVYGGVNATSRLGLHLQFDTSKLDLSAGPGRRFTVPKYYEDWTAGATFAVRPDVVLKGEYHWTESQLLETNPQPVARSLPPGELWHPLDVSLVLVRFPSEQAKR